MHRDTIDRLIRLTGMEYAQSEPDWYNEIIDFDDAVEKGAWRLWIDPEKQKPDWLPDWAHGCVPEKLYKWMHAESATNPVIHRVMKRGGMRPKEFVKRP